MSREIIWSKQAKLLAVVLAILFVISILIPHKAWSTLLLSLGGLFLLSYGWVRWLANGLSAERNLRFPWVAVGDYLEEWLEIRNDSFLPALWIEVRDQSNVPGYRASGVVGLVNNSGTRWRQRAICTQRGRFHLGPYSLHTSDPFGLFLLYIRYDSTQEIVIHPPIRSKLPVPLPAGMGDGQLRSAQQAWQAQVNAAGVRGYHPSDPMRHIHWRSSARRGSLITRTFDQDTAGDVWLLLDLNAADQLGSGIESTEEVSVLLAASLASRALTDQRAVGLAAYGETPQLLNPSRGKSQQWKLLEALALVSAETNLPLQTALKDLATIIQNKTALMIITPNADGAWLPALVPLAQRGLAMTVVLLDRGSYGDDDGGSAELRQTLRRMGVTCYLIPKGTIGYDIDINQPAERATRITPLGRAILTHPA